MPEDEVRVNRAPVLTLWAAIVAERQGHDREAALTFGKAVAGLNAQTKGRTLGIYSASKAAESDKPPKKVGLGEEFWVEVCGRPVPAKNTCKPGPPRFPRRSSVRSPSACIRSFVRRWRGARRAGARLGR